MFKSEKKQFSSPPSLETCYKAWNTRVVRSACWERLSRQSLRKRIWKKKIFLITKFTPRSLPVNHVTRERALQQRSVFWPHAGIKKRHKLFFPSPMLIIPLIPWPAATPSKSRSDNWKTNWQINHPYWIAFCLHGIICMYLSLRVLCSGVFRRYPVRFNCIKWRSTLGWFLGLHRECCGINATHIDRESFGKHVCITPNNCVASFLKKNVSLPVFGFLSWQTQTKQPLKHGPEQSFREIMLMIPHNAFW